jgi:hypothetical protein
MKLIYNTVQCGNLYPVVYNYLHSLPEIALQHEKHDMLHPLGIYNKSLYRVLQAFQNILDENDKFYLALFKDNGEINFNAQSLLKAQQELLDSLMAHIDSGYQVLKATYPAERLTKQVPFADHWLEQAGHPSVRRFKHLIKPYRDSFAPIVNKMKHEARVLRCLLMYNERERIAGYFLEGFDKQGVAGPDRKIHPGDYALSLHRDLRYHFVHLYTVGHFLMNALIEAIDKEYRIALPSSVYIETSYHEIASLAERISRLPFTFFYDEVRKPTPNVILMSSNQGMELLLDDTSTNHATSMLSWRAQVAYSGDEVTRSWRLPYGGLVHNH